MQSVASQIAEYMIWPWPLGGGHIKHCLVPSTSCDLCTLAKFEVATFKGLGGNAFTRN